MGCSVPRRIRRSRLSGVDNDARRVVLVTIHRRESWGDGVRAIGRALAHLARSDPDVLVILPLHGNPALRDSLVPKLAGLENLLIIEPLPYDASVD